MKNIFQVFGTQNAAPGMQPASLELNEQDLELVNGACGDSCYRDDDDDCNRDCDDWDYDHSDHWNRRHHRHHKDY